MTADSKTDPSARARWPQYLPSSPSSRIPVLLLVINELSLACSSITGSARGLEMPVLVSEVESPSDNTFEFVPGDN